MKKLFLLIMFIISLYAIDCKDYYNKARYYMIRGEKAVSAEGGIYYALEAYNYLKLFELCCQYGVK